MPPSIMPIVILATSPIFLIIWIVWSALAFHFLIKYHGLSVGIWLCIIGYLAISAPLFLTASQSIISLLPSLESLFFTL